MTTMRRVWTPRVGRPGAVRQRSGCGPGPASRWARRRRGRRAGGHGGGGAGEPTGRRSVELSAVVRQLEGALGVAAAEVRGAVADVGHDRVAAPFDVGAGLGLQRLVVV